MGAEEWMIVKGSGKSNSTIEKAAFILAVKFSVQVSPRPIAVEQVICDPLSAAFHP
jgi:hypothetical protein